MTAVAPPTSPASRRVRQTRERARDLFHRRQLVRALGLAFALHSSTALAADGTAAGLRQALAHHVSFDRDFRADFSRGDPALYSYASAAERAQGGSVATPQESLLIAPGAGRYGGALLRDTKSPIRVFYRGAEILRYKPRDWSGAVSIWLRTSPDTDLPPGYCDPVQIVGDSNKNGYIFLEWSRDHTPRKFRYAILPRTEIWNPNAAIWDEMRVDERPLVQVDRAPFSRAKWTHVVFTFHRLNAGSEGSGRLYIDGQLQGGIENWDLTFGWDPKSLLLVLGAAYVGHMDDLAVFDRALTGDEVDILHRLPGGVASLPPSPPPQP